jgi:transcriptional antiterminator NusG
MQVEIVKCEVMGMYWYVLFVRTGRERNVEQLLKERLNTNLFSPFVPLYEKYFKNSGILKKESKTLFPSYVFIESKVSNQDFLKSISTLIYSSSDIVRILKYGDAEFAMRESEKGMLLSLCDKNHCIEPSSGIIVGDRIHILDGPLKGWESIVRKVNRHKRQAWIEIEFMGNMRLVIVALEIVDKIKQD